MEKIENGQQHPNIQIAVEDFGPIERAEMDPITTKNFKRKLTVMKKLLYYMIRLLINMVLLVLCLPSTFGQSGKPWGLPEGAIAHHGKDTIEEVAFSSDGSRLAVAGNIGIWIYDAKTGKELKMLTGHTSPVRTVAYSPDGEILASGSDDNTLRLWDAVTGKHFSILKLKESTLRIEKVMYSPDGKVLLCASWDKIYMFNAATRKHFRTIKAIEVAKQSLSNNFLFFSIAYMPNGKTIGVGGNATSTQPIHLWDVNTEKFLHSLGHEKYFVHSVAYSPDGKTLASGCSDGAIRLWNARTRGELHTIWGQDWTGHREHEFLRGIHSVAYSPDGKTLAATSGRVILLWDVNTGNLLDMLKGHTGYVRNFAHSPDGKILASTCTDGLVMLWSLVLLNK